MDRTFDVTPEERASPLAFFRRQLFRKTSLVKKSEVELAGQTAIVTGSNTGIGFECSRQLLDLGVEKLIMAVRSVAKGEAARKELSIGISSNQTIEVWKLDLSDYDSVLEFVERTKSLEHLNIIVHNAGISKKIFQLNPKTGHDEVVQTNYLSLALLTILLLPILKAKNTVEQPGRVVLVSSDTAAWASFNERKSKPMLPAFDKEDGFDGTDRYWTSKLLGQLFLAELARRVPSSVAIVNAPNPGLCYGSNLTNEWSGGIFGLVAGTLIRILGRSTSLGARALTDAAVRYGPESHGQYVEDGKLQP